MRQFHTVNKLLRMAAGTSLMALAVNFVYEPMGLVTGGVAGISILIKHITIPWIPGGFPVGVSNFLINIPIFLLALKVMGKKFTRDTFLANVWYTIMLLVIPTGTPSAIIVKDYLLAVVVGGVLTGAGLGLVFSTRTSTGGTDLLSSVMQKKLPQYTVAQLLMCIDSIVVVLGAVAFGIRAAVYAVMAVYIASHVMDTMLEGVKFAKSVYVISEQYDEIGNRVMEKLNRGVTILDVKGMYTGKKQKMLFCAVGKKQIAELAEIIRDCDDKAFVIVQDAREVLGEGFIENCQ